MAALGIKRMATVVEETHLPLARLFNTTTAKILDFLLTNEGLFYTEAEISELAAIPPRTLQRGIQILHKEKIIARERRHKTFYYSTNLSSPRTSGLFSYVNSTLMWNLDDMKSVAGRGAPAGVSGVKMRSRPAAARKKLA